MWLWPNNCTSLELSLLTHKMTRLIMIISDALILWFVIRTMEIFLLTLSIKWEDEEVTSGSLCACVYMCWFPSAVFTLLSWMWDGCLYFSPGNAHNLCLTSLTWAMCLPSSSLIGCCWTSTSTTTNYFYYFSSYPSFYCCFSSPLLLPPLLLSPSCFYPPPSPALFPTSLLPVPLLPLPPLPSSFLPAGIKFWKWLL